MSASTTTDNKSEIECDDDEKETRVGVITPFRDSPEECARFVRLVDKVYSVKSSSFSCRLFINKLKTKDKKKTKKKIHDDDDDDDDEMHSNENEDDKVYLGYSKCGKRITTTDEMNPVVCSKCYENLFCTYLNEYEQREFKTVVLCSGEERLLKYTDEVAKIIRERENTEERESMAQMAKEKRIEEEKKRIEEEEELRRKEEEEEKLERERARLIARKLEEKEKFFSRREQREFTNKELLEIVNNTEEGKRILDREKERLELEIAKVESSADIETLADMVNAESTRTIFMRVDAFTNLKDAELMEGVSVTLSLASKEGDVIEKWNCLDVRNDAVSEEVREGVQRKLSGTSNIYYTSGAECCFQTTVGHIPENSAFILELKHFKKAKNKTSLKCWSYVATASVLSGMKREDVDVCRIFLPLGGKPVDLTTKKWINYNWKDNLMRNIATGHGAVVTFNLI